MNLKPVVFVLCLTPLAWLAWRAGFAGLGANPVETVNRFLGDWTLRFLLITLAATPVRLLTGWAGMVRLRRMLGLFAFAYAVLHAANYAAVEQSLIWADIWADVVKRQYITAGALTFLMLVPLAATSTKGMVKRLGGKRWKRLHQLVYLAAIGGVVHYLMMVKADLLQPLIHGGILALLLGTRAAAHLANTR
ncbi:MAG TPA: sulfoxide reductase heme-binding subunit YedZ, partial [Rhodospirillales bacterium]|nr:sulfoxide reductase heme-binding subunit YedZ [Rhodospirillales bacterium]